MIYLFSSYLGCIGIFINTKTRIEPMRRRSAGDPVSLRRQDSRWTTKLSGKGSASFLDATSVGMVNALVIGASSARLSTGKPVYFEIQTNALDWAVAIPRALLWDATWRKYASSTVAGWYGLASWSWQKSTSVIPASKCQAVWMKHGANLAMGIWMMNCNRMVFPVYPSLSALVIICHSPSTASIPGDVAPPVLHQELSSLWSPIK